MFVPFAKGFGTGLVLQLALGPIFFFVTSLTLGHGFGLGFSAVLGVVLVDYVFIFLSVLGVGSLLQKDRTKKVIAKTSAILLCGFGIYFFITAPDPSVEIISGVSEKSWIDGFFEAALMTLANPLTIVFWTSLFSARATELRLSKTQLVVFGVGAGFSTLVFLTIVVGLLSLIGFNISPLVVHWLNRAVGVIVFLYGLVRLFKASKLAAH